MASLAEHSGQGARFVAVGLAVTGLHALMQWGWCNGVGVPPWLGYLLALAVSFSISFALHRSLTFRSSAPLLRAVPAFAALQAGQQALNYAVFLLLCWLLGGRWFGAHAHLVALGLSCAIVAIPAYLGALRVFRLR